MGKLIVLEGLDGSGKSTQLNRLAAALPARGVDCRTVSFPDYDSDSSALVRMYLSGAFGDKPDDVNAYAAATFYAVDRYASFRRSWGDFYNAGGTVLSGRYVTSNAVHQASKLPREAWGAFLDWLSDFEYNKLGVPRPDLVLFLDMPTDVSQRLLANRYGGDENRRDIHERDLAYLEHCRQAARFAAQVWGWQTVPCAHDGQARPIDDIAAELLDRVLAVL